MSSKGVILSEHAYRRLTASVKRSERAYRNDRSHRRRSISRGSSSIAIATLSGTLSPGGSASATFVVGGTGTVTVYDKLLCSSDSLASGATVVIAKIDGQWYVINATCACS